MENGWVNIGIGTTALKIWNQVVVILHLVQERLRMSQEVKII